MNKNHSSNNNFADESTAFIFELLYRLNFQRKPKNNRNNLLNRLLNNYFSGWIIGLGMILLFLTFSWIIAPYVRIPVNIPIYIKGIMQSIPTFFLPFILIIMLISTLCPVPYRFSLFYSNQSEVKYLAAILGECSWKQIVTRLELTTRLKIFTYIWVRLAFMCTLLGCMCIYMIIYYVPKMDDPYTILRFMCGIVIDFGFFGFFSVYFIFRTGLLIRLGLLIRGFSTLVQYSGLIIWNLWWIFWGVWLKNYADNLEKERVDNLEYSTIYIIGIISLILITMLFQYLLSNFAKKARFEGLKIKPLIILLASPIVVIGLYYIVANIEYAIGFNLEPDIFKYITASLHSLAYIVSAPSIGHWIPTEYWLNIVNDIFDLDSPNAEYWFWTILITAQIFTFIIIPYQVSKFIELYALQYPVSKDKVKPKSKASQLIETPSTG